MGRTLSATGDDPDKPIGPLLDPEERERFHKVHEINSGVVLFNKSDEQAHRVLVGWAEECAELSTTYSQLYAEGELNLKRDQAALRVALFRHAKGMKIGLSQYSS